MVSARIPTDDRMLEMEEVEGLLTSPAKQRKATTAISMCDKAYRGRWGLCLFTIIAVVCVLFASDSENLRFWEGKGGDNVDNVEQKRPSQFVMTKEFATNPPVKSPAPIPSTVKPVPATNAPVDTPAPTPATTAPVETPAPVPATAAPVATPAPVPATAAPIDTPAPVPATEPPVDTAAPVPATEPPVETPAPVPATEPPVETAAPVPATEPPVETPAPVPATDAPVENPGTQLTLEDAGATSFPKPDQIVRLTRPGAEEQQVELAKEWGKWEFSDPKADSRPKDDYCAEYPNRDIPRSKFPKDAWQTDKEYLEKFLDEGLKLVNRSMEAILAEYGKGKKDKPDEDFLKRSEMFQLSFLNFTNGDQPNGGKNPQENGGWITQRSFEGLKRRLWHALITNDSFNVILGGHSAAAGHGNNFKQSYMMQFHKVMEPVFAFLKVPLTSRNLAQGGLGTIQSALGARSIYGDEIDIMIWDSGMTEGRDSRAVDLFERQALIGGNRVPLLYGGMFGNLKMLHDECDADIGQFGTGLLGIDTCENEVQAMTIPYAARYMKCTSERSDLCGSHRFDSICWPADYTGPIVPSATQAEKPGSQVSWHPGNLVHQLTGRVIAMGVLFALKEALTQWKETPDFALPDELWHVTSYYDNIRKKVRELTLDKGECMRDFDGVLPIRVCNTSLFGATEFTPRANPDKTSLQRLIKPAENGYIPHLAGTVEYTGPGPYNPKLDPPDGAIDVLSIISNGRDYSAIPSGRRRLDGDEVTPGLGWNMNGDMGYCDGTWNSECGRRLGETCLISGHSDGRGGLFMDGYAGWLVMTVPVKEGIIISKIETWHSVDSNPITRSWKSENNKRRNLRRSSLLTINGTRIHYDESDIARDKRRLKPEPPAYCDEFRFEYAIDGKITSLDKDVFSTNFSKPIQRVVEVQTLLDDSDYTKGETKLVEVGIRMVGCHDSTRKAMHLTHMYWA